MQRLQMSAYEPRKFYMGKCSEVGSIREGLAQTEAAGWVRSRGKKAVERAFHRHYPKNEAPRLIYSTISFAFFNPDTRKKLWVSFRFEFEAGTVGAELDARPIGRTYPPLTPGQQRTAAWMRCKMHGCIASAVYGGLCMAHKDWEQDACKDCGQVFPLDELTGVWEGDGGYNLCEFCHAKYPWQAIAPDKSLTPELWY